jgi:hypothetical protein
LNFAYSIGTDRSLLEIKHRLRASTVITAKPGKAQLTRMDALSARFSAPAGVTSQRRMIEREKLSGIARFLAYFQAKSSFSAPSTHLSVMRKNAQNDPALHPASVTKVTPDKGSR